jgi:hypothetical protein
MRYVFIGLRQFAAVAIWCLVLVVAAIAETNECSGKAKQRLQRIDLTRSWSAARFYLTDACSLRPVERDVA